MIQDPFRFQFMMFHILSNAIKYNQEVHGSIDLTLSFQPLSATEGKLRCVIKDTGVGMTQE
jgi:signal transduction histidine kinase